MQIVAKTLRKSQLVLYCLLLAVTGSCGGSSSSTGVCEAGSCSGNGSCDDSSGSIVCTCDTGYTGASCASCASGYHDDGNGMCISDSGCQTGSCSKHGSCDDSGGSIVCSCDTGYSGDSCDACATGYHDNGNGYCVQDSGPHPTGWADPAQHGVAAKTGSLDCRSCHGQDLNGQGDAPSCDSCHEAGWRTNCTFCHGGTDNQSGAPPVDLDGSTDTGLQTVGAHTQHVAGGNHMTYDCGQCHVKPTDVLSPGHVFDNTPGQAEVDFSDGLSSSGSYDDPGCSTLYCHGDGQHDNGSMADFTQSINSCSACHGVPPNTGQHQRHVNMGYECQRCHADVAGDGNTITGPDLHVNGEKNVNLQGGGNWDSTSGSCDPGCHGSKHW